MTHEKRIEIRWRDLDAFRHVNNAVYATYLEEARDEWLVLGRGGDVWDYVLARVAIDFRREVDHGGRRGRRPHPRWRTSAPRASTLRGGGPEPRRDARSRGRVGARRARPRDRPLATTDRRGARDPRARLATWRPPQVDVGGWCAGGLRVRPLFDARGGVAD